MKLKILRIITILTLSAVSYLNAGFANTDKLLEEAKKEAGEITPSVLKSMIDKEVPVIILDIRESEQRSEGEIYSDESYSITRGNLEFEIGNKIKNKDSVIVTYCRGGSRGALAAQTLRRLGYKNATNLKGGLKAWAKAGYPVETGLGSVTIKSIEE
ncbi:sulfurtransferase [Sulfurimonas aquatica]|uniref:Sulfurtransferase n=1 Tax=Sulfurimonas aquatica TaxID=2672570 RepID=A0A975B027_9BACT|nr:rhodanese-like domain-containing protein [Sulfurimonas aquatica]QSZ41665.1 sulfurtransferase [Sulfurimonas aquatica]